MNPKQIAQFHREIFRELNEAWPYALPEEALWSGVHYELPQAQRQDLDRELAYLAAKGLVAHQPHATSPGFYSWKLTAEGVEHIRREKLLE